MWYSNVVVELFQVDISISQQSEMSVDKMISALIFLKKCLGKATCNFSSLIPYVLHSKFRGLRGLGGGEPGLLLGNSGSVAACSRK